MDVIINELSLTGQFKDEGDFWKSGMPPFLDAMQDVTRRGTHYVLKKGGVDGHDGLYNAPVTKNKTLYNLLTGSDARINDMARKYKSTLSRAINEPYWDLDSQQDSRIRYFVDDTNVTGSSVAEAAARSSCLLSFVRSSYMSRLVSVTAGGADIPVANIWDGSQLFTVLYEAGEMSFQDYVTAKFKDGNLNFTQIDDRFGFNLISDLNRDEFLKVFQKFHNHSWSEIHTDSGFDYKAFTKNRRTHRFFSNEFWGKGIYKFRITQRVRCFGYVEAGVFFVLRFDLDHELSDLG